MSLALLRQAFSYLPKLRNFPKPFRSGCQIAMVLCCGSFKNRCGVTKPAARLVPLDEAPVEQRIGAARGRFEVPDDIDAHNDEVARLFLGTGAVS